MTARLRLGGAVLELDEQALHQLAEQLAPVIADLSTAGAEAWLTAKEAAAYISAKPKRIYDLKEQGVIPSGGDGRKLLFRRSALDAYLERGS
jgi:excisionase family DNA binding protein